MFRIFQSVISNQRNTSTYNSIGNVDINDYTILVIKKNENATPNPIRNKVSDVLINLYFRFKATP